MPPILLAVIGPATNQLIDKRNAKRMAKNGWRDLK